MQKTKALIFTLFLLIFISSFVAAQPPFQQFTFEQKGLQIEFQKFEYLKQNQPFEVNIHVFNSTTGLLVTNNTAECHFHLYKENGTLAYNPKMTFHTPHDFTTTIPSNILTQNKGSFSIHCNTSSTGGFVSGPIRFTRTGKELLTPEAILYLILALGVLLLFVLSFYFMISVPYSNKVNEKGAVIKLTRLKYVKLGFILLTWVLLTWLLNILVGLSDNFISLTMYYGFFGFVFDIMNRLALPVGIIVLITAIFEIIKDANIQKAIKKFGSAER